MKRLICFIVASLMVLVFSSEAFAKGSLGGSRGFSSSSRSMSTFRSTSSGYSSKSSGYSSNNTVKASSWSWNTPSPAPVKPVIQPTRITAPTTYATSSTVASATKVSPPSPRTVYVAPVVTHKVVYVQPRHNDTLQTVANVAVTAAAINSLANSAHASTS